MKIRSIYLFLLVLLCFHKNILANDRLIKTMQEAAQPSIAIVDLQYILENSLAIKDLRAQIETITKDLHDKMTQKELDLKKDEENLIRLKGKILPNESEKEASNFNKKVTEAQKYAQQQKLKLEKAHSEGILQVHSGTIKVIKEICEAKGFVLVLPSSQILYANDSLNITQEVLDTLNKQIKTIKVQF